MPPVNIVIGGPPRSGTRFVADALNKHPDVAIQGEVPPDVLDHAIQFIYDCDQSFKKSTHKRWTKVWSKSRIDMFNDILMSVQKRADGVVPPDVRRKATFNGFKLPTVERRMEELESIYKTPKFIMTIREFEPYHLSCVSRWPHLTIKDTSLNYCKSLGAIREAVDRNDMTFVFPLEHLRSHGLALLKELGMFLGLSNVDVWASVLDPQKKANEAEKFTKKKRVELSDAEKRYIDKMPNMRMLYESVIVARTYTERNKAAAA